MLVARPSVARRSVRHLAAVGVAMGLALSQARASDLGADVKRAINQAKVGNARIGVCIMDVESGSSLVDVNGAEGFIPASNMKLLTSGAALMILGPDFHFKTEFVLNGDRLVVRGAGDPALADPELIRELNPPTSVEDILTGLSQAVAKTGVSSLKEIVLDDRVFDREYVHPSWNKANLLQGYSAEIGGLNFHANVLRIYPKPNPQGAGAPPIVEIEPQAPWLVINNKAQTVAQTRNNVRMDRPALENRFTLFGEVGGSASVQFDVTVHDGATMFGNFLADRLQREGVRVGDSRSTSVRLATLDEDLSQGRTVAVISTPLIDVLGRCNTHSENLYAECLMKTLGHAVTREPGSWTNGAAVLRMILTEKLGPHAVAGTNIADGSGLSRDNLVTPRILASWLKVLSDSPNADAFVSSLARPGLPGTLERRFRSVKLTNELTAKSGYINRVRCLSGYITHQASGHRVAFSILANDVSGDVDSQVLRLHEEIVRLADEWLSQTSPAESSKIGG